MLSSETILSQIDSIIVRMTILYLRAAGDRANPAQFRNFLERQRVGPGTDYSSRFEVGSGASVQPDEARPTIGCHAFAPLLEGVQLETQL